MPFRLGRVVALLFALTTTFISSTHGYGPAGHQLVGAIADERLAGTPAGEQVKTFLTGITLQKASVIADEIKGWDKNGVGDSQTIYFFSPPKNHQEMRAFLRGNQTTPPPKTPQPSH